MTKSQLTQYIEINHHFMTLQEMADETKAPYPTIYSICQRKGFKPMTLAERAEMKTKEKQIKPVLSAGAKQFIADFVKSIEPRKKIERKLKATYNQSGSDLLDEIRGIKTTDRNDKLL